MTNEDQKAKEVEKLDEYHRIADTVGMIPGLRMKDNVFQALFIFVSLMLGVAIGFVVQGGIGALVGGFAGLLGGLFLSGIILMVIGWVRATKRR